MCKEKALAAIEDEQVGVPIVLTGFGGRELRGLEDVEELLGAAKDHGANAMSQCCSTSHSEGRAHRTSGRRRPTVLRERPHGQLRRKRHHEGIIMSLKF